MDALAMKLPLAPLARFTVAAGAAVALSGCAGLEVKDTASLLAPSLQRSEILGFFAGLGTSSAAVPDLVTRGLYLDIGPWAFHASAVVPG